MKNTLLTTLLLLICLWLHGQTITGKVYRAGTDSVIAGATVYYGGSMAGAVTDNSGWFELLAKQQQIPVVVSCIGYYSATANYNPGKPLTIYLKPKIEELHTVTILADGMNRNDEIALFLRDFMGTSNDAKSCTIANMDDIYLFYNNKTQTLTATCDKPIMIENKMLGYTISYYLDQFTDTPDNFIIEGNYIFKESGAPADEAKIKRNRENAYQGSRMQFVRGLWHHTLQKAGFSIYNIGVPLTEDKVLTVDSAQQKYIHWKSRLYIYHYNSSSYLNLVEENSFIDKDGFYSAGIQWGGALSRQRIGDLLPFEYQSEKELKETPAADHYRLSLQ